MPAYEPLPVAVRAYTEPVMVGSGNARRQTSNEQTYRALDNHRDVLIFDTETRTDPSQKLMFGVWRYCKWDADSLVCVDEGIFTADDLPDADRQLIDHYCHAHRLDTGADQSGRYASSPILKTTDVGLLHKDRREAVFVVSVVSRR